MLKRSSSTGGLVNTEQDDFSFRCNCGEIVIIGPVDVGQIATCPACKRDFGQAAMIKLVITRARTAAKGTHQSMPC